MYTIKAISLVSYFRDRDRDRDRDRSRSRPRAPKPLSFLLIITLLFNSSCTGFFFYPMRDHVLTPDQLNLVYEDVYFTSFDEEVLHAWFIPASGASVGTVFFLHGNAENVSTHIHSVYWLPKQGFNLFLLEYRGYGASGGRPVLSKMFRDIEFALQEMMSRSDVDARRVVVLGQSLGGSMALHAVAHSRYLEMIRAVVVESAFSSYRQIAREKFGSFFLTALLKWPLSWTIPDTYSPSRSVGDLSPLPLLLIHGDADQIVPVHHALDLYERAEEPKELWIVPGGRHIQAFTNAEYRKRLVSYLRNVMTPG